MLENALSEITNGKSVKIMPSKCNTKQDSPKKCATIE
jgi:hypothetical protein